MRKVYFILILIIATNLNLNAQNKSSLDFSFGVENSAKDLFTAKNDITTINGTIIKDLDKPKTNLSAAISYNLRIHKKILLKTGLRYSAYTNFRGEFQDDHVEDDRYILRIGNGGYIKDTRNTDLNLSYSFRYIGIPILMRYEFGQEKINFYLEGGLTTNYYLESVAKIKGDVSSLKVVTKIDGINQYNFYTTISSGINCQISHTFQLFAQANLNYQIDKTLGRRVSSYGIEMGIRKLMRFE